MVCPVLNRKQLEMGRFELKKRADQGRFCTVFQNCWMHVSQEMPGLIYNNMGSECLRLDIDVPAQTGGFNRKAEEVRKMQTFYLLTIS
jgi:hypothetical protein